MRYTTALVFSRSRVTRTSRAEIELAEIPLQVPGADVMIDAIDAALENRKVPLNRVVCALPRTYSLIEWLTV